MAALECSGGEGMRWWGVNRAWAARALEEDGESRRQRERGWVGWAGLGVPFCVSGRWIGGFWTDLIDFSGFCVRIN
jgi:hypothetical protein